MDEVKFEVPRIPEHLGISQPQYPTGIPASAAHATGNRYNMQLLKK